MKYALLILLLPFLATAQNSKEPIATNISYEGNFGLVSSYMGTPFYFGCGGRLCFTTNESLQPVSTKYWSSMVNYHLNLKHRFGVGVLYSQHGFRRVFQYEANLAWGHENEVRAYIGLKLRHRMDLLQGKMFKLGFANSLDFEKLQDEYLELGLTKYSISHVLECVASVPVAANFEANLSVLARSVLTQNSKYAWAGGFHRFGIGATLGINFRI